MREEEQQLLVCEKNPSSSCIPAAPAQQGLSEFSFVYTLMSTFPIVATSFGRPFRCQDMEGGREQRKHLFLYTLGSFAASSLVSVDVGI